MFDVVDFESPYFLFDYENGWCGNE
jgi:hypothetical protein